MKTKIGKIEIEGTPEEFNTFISAYLKAELKGEPEEKPTRQHKAKKKTIKGRKRNKSRSSNKTWTKLEDLRLWKAITNGRTIAEIKKDLLPERSKNAIRLRFYTLKKQGVHIKEMVQGGN